MPGGHSCRALAAIVAMLAAGPRPGAPAPDVLSRRDATRQDAPRYTVTPLTTHGRAARAAISTDGRRIAYVHNEDAGPRIQLLDRETGPERLLVPGAAVEYWGINFTPDGDAVYLVQATPATGAVVLLRVSVATRQVQHVRDSVGGQSALSPDGRQIAFVRVTADPGASSLIVASLDGGPERTIARRLHPAELGWPGWTPDGTALVFNTLDVQHRATLVEFRLQDGTERALATPGWINANPPAWLPGGGAFVTSSRGQLWRVSYPDGAVEPLGSDGARYVNTVGAPAAGVIVATRRQGSTSDLVLITLTPRR